MLHRFSFATRNQLSVSARQIIHVVLLLSLLLGYAPLPVSAAPPEPDGPEIAEPAGIDEVSSDPEAGIPEFTEDPPVAEEPMIPWTYEEIEAAGSQQVWPAELPPPPAPEPREMEQAADNAINVAEEPAIIEIGEDLPDSAFAPAWDESLLDVPELALDAFAEEVDLPYKAGQSAESTTAAVPNRVLLPFVAQAGDTGVPSSSTWLLLDQGVDKQLFLLLPEKTLIQQSGAQTLRVRDSVLSARYLPDGRIIAVTSDLSLVLLDSNWQETVLLPEKSANGPLFVSPDATRVAYWKPMDFEGGSIPYTNGIAVFELPTQREMTLFVLPYGSVHLYGWLDDLLVVEAPYWNKTTMEPSPIMHLGAISSLSPSTAINLLAKLPALQFGTNYPVTSIDQSHLAYDSSNGIVIVDLRNQQFVEIKAPASPEELKKQVLQNNFNAVTQASSDLAWQSFNGVDGSLAPLPSTLATKPVEGSLGSNPAGGSSVNATLFYRPVSDNTPISAYKDLDSRSGYISDWTGWTGTSWVYGHSYDQHEGADYDGSSGDPIYPANTGTVETVFVECANTYPNLSYGTNFRITHGTLSDGNSYATGYAHLRCENVRVASGQSVSSLTDQIADMGNTGNSTGAHMHLNIRQNGVLVDPYQLGIIGSAATNNPPPSNCDSYSYNGVALFENKECNGDKREYGSPMGGVENLTDVGWNDRTSSVYVTPNWSVRVWSDINTGGSSRCLSWSMWDLSQDKYDNTDTRMDESISSIKVYNNGNCTDSDPSGRAKLFSEPGWTGNVVWEGGVGSSNEPNANSYSMDLPDGWSAITYREDGGRGQQRCWSGDVRNFQDFEDWQNKTQSIEVFSNDVCPKPPAAPANPRINGVSESSITLGWDDRSDNEANFNVYRWNGSDYAHIASVGSGITSYTDGGLACGTSYSYKIRAVNGAGDSAMTDAVTASTSACAAPGVPALTAPGNGTIYDEGQPIVLDWESAANATEYFGEITGGPDPLTFGWQGDTIYTAGSLWAGYQYTWHVKSRRGDPQSDWSESRTFTVRPGAPANLAATTPGCSKVNLTWGDGSGSEEGYRIYRNGNLVGEVGTNVTTFAQSSVPAGEYTYNVYAYRGGILSASSNTAQVTVAACTPLAQLTTGVTPAAQVHNGVTRVDTRFTLRESAGTAVQIQSYTTRWYSADGSVTLSDASNPSALSRSIPGGGSATWSISLLLPRTIGQMAADRGESAVRLHFTFRGVDAAGRAVQSSANVILKFAACGDATEPNNAPGYARYTSYGQTQAAAICPAGERDIFTFLGVAGDRIRIAARLRSGSAPLDPKLELLGSDRNTVLASNNDRISGQVDARIAYVLPTTGRYYIRVTDAGRRGGPGQAYDLLLHKDSSPPVAAIRPLLGGRWLHAGLQEIRIDASDGQTEVERVVFWGLPAGASEWLYLGADYTAADGWHMNWNTSRLPAGSGYAIYAWVNDGAGNLRGVGLYDLRLERTPPTVSATAIRSYGDAPFRAFVVKWDNGVDRHSGIRNYDVQVRKGAAGAWTNWLSSTTLVRARYAGAVGQTYYFRVRARDKTGNVSAYASGAGDAQFTVKVCPVAKDAYEVDDRAQEAKAIRNNGSRYRHNFHLEGNADWIKFSASAGVTYLLRTYAIEKHADTVLTLYNTDAKTVLATNDDFDSASGASRIIWKAPVTGTYYASISHQDRYGFGCTTIYDVALFNIATAGASEGAAYEVDNRVDGELAPPGDFEPLDEPMTENGAQEKTPSIFLPLVQSK